MTGPAGEGQAWVAGSVSADGWVAPAGSSNSGARNGLVVGGREPVTVRGTTVSGAENSEVVSMGGLPCRDGEIRA